MEFCSFIWHENFAGTKIYGSNSNTSKVYGYNSDFHLLLIQAYIDGGFTDNIPQNFKGTTITVSPFSGESDICPDDTCTSTNQIDYHNSSLQLSCNNIFRVTKALFPPNNDVLLKMCSDGFNDALKYLYNNCKLLFSLITCLQYLDTINTLC